MSVLTAVQYETVINQLRQALRKAREEIAHVVVTTQAGQDILRQRHIIAEADLAFSAARIIDEVAIDP